MISKLFNNSWITIALILGSLFLGYLLFRQKGIVELQDKLIKESTDTLHKFKTDLGNKGGYISTLEGDRNSLINILKIKSKEDSSYLVIIDSLRKDKSIQGMSVVKTERNSTITHKIDTIYKSLYFQDSVHTKWYDASIKVEDGESKWNIKTKDELYLTNKLKDNKGLFTGSTLTTYAVSANKDEDISGITSVSTVINKPKIRIAPAVGIGYNTDLQGKNGRFGLNAGVVITFK